MSEDTHMDLQGLTSSLAEKSENSIKRTLSAVRRHLGMQVAYVSEFADDQVIFREVDAPGFEHLIAPGNSMPLDYVYCRHILEGRLPELMPDVSRIDMAADMPFTHEMGIGAHLSVPIKLADGSVHGMFCCISTDPEPTLNPRDLEVMRAFAELSAVQISRDVEAVSQRRADRKRIQQILEGEELSLVLQPIARLSDNRIMGFEVLSRFSGPEGWTPDIWFNRAAEAGLGAELELKVVEMSMGLLDTLPKEFFLSINVSPETIILDALASALPRQHRRRIVLEITEHASVEDYQELSLALVAMRAQGVKLAVDDAGAGYASLRHILALQPDVIKLDMSLTRDIQKDPARHALAAALVHFGQETKCQILAEGIETALELEALRNLGVQSGQGYFLGRPMPAAEALSLGPTRATVHPISSLASRRA